MVTIVPMTNATRAVIYRETNSNDYVKVLALLSNLWCNTC